MAATKPQPNIWAQMAYAPPRGFMIHPLKAASSFDCDGCGHHASFHRTEEEKAARRWKAEEMAEEVQLVETEMEMENRALKRRRIEGDIVEVDSDVEWNDGLGMKGSIVGVKGRKRKERD